MRLTISRGVAVIELSAPRTGNRIDLPLAAELRSVADLVAGDDSVRAVLMIAGGRDFCLGGTDLRATQGGLDGLRVADAVARIPQPVVVAVRGRAYDQGLELALAGDLRVAAHGARFAMRQVGAGGMPFDGGTQRLPRIAGRGLAIDMLLTGREIDANEALAAGLVTRLFAPAQLEVVARKIAVEVAGRGDAAGRFAKEAITAGPELPIDSAMRLEGDLSILLHHDPERIRALNAWRKLAQR